MTEMIATRDGYGKALLEIGKDKKIVALDADLSESTRSLLFAEKYPERFFEMGISEQDMVATAGGLAASGKVPFASSFACFITTRALDQIRLNACISDLPVRIVGSHAGLLTGEDGASHQALEDIATMRALPNMTVIQPADAVEAGLAVKALADHKGPAYLRLARGKVPVIFDDKYRFKIGKAVELRKGNDIAIFATGALVHEALKVHDMLKEHKISARIINIHTIKPIDKEMIVKAAKETGLIVTCEDHNIIGGLGSAVAEVLSDDYPSKIIRIGVNDRFGESGTAEQLYKKHGLDSDSITQKILRVIKK